MAKARPLEHSKVVPMLDTPTDLSPEARRQISGALNVVLADTFAQAVRMRRPALERRISIFAPCLSIGMGYRRQGGSVRNT